MTMRNNLIDLLAVVVLLAKAPSFVGGANSLNVTSFRSSSSNVGNSLRGRRYLMDMAMMEDFVTSNLLVEGDDFDVQDITGDTFQVDKKKTVSFAPEDLEVIETFSETAAYFVDGVQQESLPPPAVFQGKDDPAMMVTLDEHGNLEQASIVDEATGETLSLIPAAEGSTTFVTVKESDIDEEKLSMFKYGEPEIAPDNYMSANSLESYSAPKTYNSNKNKNNTFRALQSVECPSYRVIEVAIAYDTSFCSYFGGQAAADRKVQTIISGVSEKYKQKGLCMMVVMSHLEGYCDASVDPYRAMLEKANADGNNACAVLYPLQEYWAENRSNVQQDAMHLFHGYNLPSNTIGCAFVSVLCSSYAMAVNEISYTGNQELQNILVAHELGHNAGAGHCSGCTNIMRSSICKNCKTFSQQSINSISNHATGKTCLEEITGPFPSMSPTMSPTVCPSSEPSPNPTRIPTGYPTGGPTLPPSQGPTVSPSESTSPPTDAPTPGPSPIPSNAPTTGEPTVSPSGMPVTDSPTKAPTLLPTVSPTTRPTTNPTVPLDDGDDDDDDIGENPPFVSTSSPTDKPSPGPTKSPTVTPTQIPTDKPSPGPTKSPTVTPTQVPTHTPTTAPTIVPTMSPTGFPTASPSGIPTVSPRTETPTVASGHPSEPPSTSCPTLRPTDSPSASPTPKPTGKPTESPTKSPTACPTPKPTGKPSESPTKSPTASPTPKPTGRPTGVEKEGPVPPPTFVPTVGPTNFPTIAPTVGPTGGPTQSPSDPRTVPTARPTGRPTVAPSDPSFEDTLPPSGSPTLAPMASSHWVMCGKTNRCTEKNRIADPGELHEVRCCSDSTENPGPGWKKHSGCSVWAESDLAGPTGSKRCYSNKNLQEAQKICALSDARLCTKDELEARCTHGTGCLHDRDLIWSSTTANPDPTSTPSMGPNPFPTESPSTGPSLLPVIVPSTFPTGAPFESEYEWTNPPVQTDDFVDTPISDDDTEEDDKNLPATPAPSDMKTLAPTIHDDGYIIDLPPAVMPPTSKPTESPTTSPSGNPSGAPTMSPTSNPSKSPTANPTDAPNKSPSTAPSKSPTESPSVAPSVVCQDNEKVTFRFSSGRIADCDYFAIHHPDYFCQFSLISKYCPAACGKC